MEKWEYHIVSRATPRNQSFSWTDGRIENASATGEEVLNGLGQEGWELVSVVSIPRGDGAAEVHYFFKRPKKK